MSELLPERINAELLAQQHTRLAGVIPLQKMPRLARCLVAPAGDAVAEVEFAVGTGGRAIVRGHAGAQVQLTCQRCLEIVAWPLKARFLLALAHNDDEAAALPDEFEPLMWQDGSGSLPELIEDELLLALPAVARHADPADCGPVEELMRPAADEESADNPFAALNQLKSGRREH